MKRARKARLFKNGESQTVGSPAEFRFECNDTSSSRSITQEVSFSTRLEARKDFLAFLASRRPENVPDDWMRVAR